MGRLILNDALQVRGPELHGFGLLLRIVVSIVDLSNPSRDVVQKPIGDESLCAEFGQICLHRPTQIVRFESVTPEALRTHFRLRDPIVTG